MKLSYFASKVLIGFSIGALLSSNALASKITIKDGDGSMEKHFETNDGQHFALKKEHTNSDLTIEINDTDLPNSIAKEGYEDLATVSIDLGSNDLTIKNISSGNLSTAVSNYTITANKTEATNVIFQSMNGKSIVNGDFSIKGSSEPTEGVFDYMKSSAIFIADGHGLQGSLEINGNFTADKSILATIGGNKSQNHIQVNGKANITNSNFSIGTTSFGDLALNNYVFMSASEGFNKDITSSNKASANISKSLESIVGMSTKDLGLDYEDTKAMDVKEFVDYKLSTKDNKLLISGGANKNVLDNKKVLESDKKYLELIKKDLKKEEENGNKDKIDEAIAKLDKQIQQIDEMIKNTSGGIISNDDYIKNDSSVSASNKNFVSKILDGLTLGKDFNAIGNIKFDKVGEQVANDIKDSAKSISNVNQASSGINSTINVSNDVSIGSRVAMLNNPYGNYATKLSQIRFATNDYGGNYVDNYNNSIWGNIIGGANIIDGDSGALYGATIGMDRKINDDVIIGAYFTYANAKIKDNLLTQKSDNFQFGAYSNIYISPKVEVNVKAYAQFSPTDQDIVNRGFNTTNSADFNRKFFGLSANMGYVFDFSDNTLFVKPFTGANYYYAHTPSYKENGIAGKDVSSASNNSISLEFGAELRKYMSEESYLFITPKIEQYVINNGDDFVASLNGVTLPSVKGNDKKKTYGQIIVGGNVDISEQFSLNAGIGAKQILAGKTDGKNETYISGQVGFKYKF
ncbi:autotransporter outer membrane beta-barrel domain-containing protein [Campylobacter insulaenigrae]|uniref:Autotransporter domain protein n=1 Tax=Campylobacter insulaenigrae NCTC 12927 TaxID=1031564 RepID=A0A0A8H2M8_9BACT|nr:autotransporter outer membrane beta-barrel domain-containing protein [Campylobacter insulaenigrae]AJC87915.1 autotransporter domain protein [Campylobacter insulaenigrae NCTC 12927]VEH94380.1 Vacuolating cytotoxin autotransporter precursor [Campylobacter insulaenigrae]